MSSTPPDVLATLSSLPAWALIVAVAAAALGAWLVFRLGRFVGRRERLHAAREGSRRALAGQLAEQWAPVLPGFPGDPADARFFGAPIDFVVFDGLSTGSIDEVLFVEVKSGRSSLSRVQRSLRDCIRDGRVRWVEHRVDAPS